VRTECAWCGRVLRDGPPFPVSDGICAACMAKLMHEHKDRQASGRAVAGGERWNVPAQAAGQ